MDILTFAQLCVTLLIGLTVLSFAIMFTLTFRKLNERKY